MRLTKLIQLFIVSFFFMACSPAVKKQEDSPQQTLVARAGSEVLSLDQYRREMISTGIITDSAYVARQNIERWALGSLFYQEAVAKIGSSNPDIDQQVENYRKSLVNHAYESRLVEDLLDTVVEADEVQEYYEDHKQNFLLRENILKVNYVKVPLQSSGLEKIKKVIHSDKPKDQEQIQTLCLQYAESFFMNDSTWLFAEAVKKEIPQLRDDPSYVLVPGRVLEFNDDENYYYLKVKDVKTKNTLSPLDFERSNIRKFILNRRKAQLLLEYKHSLLEKARNDKQFVIY